MRSGDAEQREGPMPDRNLSFVGHASAQAQRPDAFRPALARVPMSAGRAQRTRRIQTRAGAAADGRVTSETAESRERGTTFLAHDHITPT